MDTIFLTIDCVIMLTILRITFKLNLNLKSNPAATDVHRCGQEMPDGGNHIHQQKEIWNFFPSVMAISLVALVGNMPT